MKIVNFISLSMCIKKLQQNSIIAYPTESILGLGCNPDSEFAIQELLRLKKRRWIKGFILVASKFSQIRPYILENKLSIDHKKILAANWPGYITYLLPAKSSVSCWLTGNSNLIAVRISSHDSIVKLCNLFGKAIISTSANISGKKPCKTYLDFFNQFGITVPILYGTLGTKVNPSRILNIFNGQLIRHD